MTQNNAQENQECLIKIATPDAKTVFCEISYLGKILYTDSFHSLADSLEMDYFFPWLFIGFKTIFDLPLTAKTHIQLAGDAAFHESFIPLIKMIINMIGTTRQKIESFQPLRQQTENFKGKLFLNLGDAPMLISLYQQALQEDPDHAHYDACYFLDAYFTHKPTHLPSLEELMAVIVEKKIKTIFSHNTSYIRYFLQYHQVFLPALMEKIGVEWVIVDFDTYNQTQGFHYVKKMFHTPACRRYCVMPHIETYWDQTLGLKNIQYIPMPFLVEGRQGIQKTDTYQIIITTWCRLAQTLHSLKPILLFLSYIDLSQPVRDYQFFFHALVHQLQNSTLPLLLSTSTGLLLKSSFSS